MMTKSKSIIPNKREQLLSKERKLVAELESDATEVESNLQSTLKTLAIIGAGVLAATIIYKLASPESSSKKAKKKKLKGNNGAPSAITTSIVSMALQKLLPFAIEKFSTLNSQTRKNETAAEKTSR